MIGSFPELEKLPKNEKFVLAGELWHQAMNDESSEPDAEISKVLEDRLDEYLAKPESGLSWDDVKQRLRNSDDR